MGISEPSAVIWLQFSFLNKCVKWDILAWISPRNPQNTGSCPQNVSSDYAPDPGSQHITAMERREAKHISYTVFKDGVFFLSPLNTGAFIEKNPLRCCQNGSETSGHGPLGVSCGSGTEALAVESRWGQGCWLGSFWCILQMLDWIGIWGLCVSCVMCSLLVGSVLQLELQCLSGWDVSK